MRSAHGRNGRSRVGPHCYERCPASSCLKASGPHWNTVYSTWKTRTPSPGLEELRPFQCSPQWAWPSSWRSPRGLQPSRSNSSSLAEYPFVESRSGIASPRYSFIFGYFILKPDSHESQHSTHKPRRTQASWQPPAAEAAALEVPFPGPGSHRRRRLAGRASSKGKATPGSGGSRALEDRR